MPSNVAPSYVALSLLCFKLFNCASILFPPSVSRWNNLNFGLDSDLEVTNPNRYYFIAYFIITQFVPLLYQSLPAHKLITVCTNWRNTKPWRIILNLSTLHRILTTQQALLPWLWLKFVSIRNYPVQIKNFKFLHFSLGVTNLHKTHHRRNLQCWLLSYANLLKLHCHEQSATVLGLIRLNNQSEK